MATSYSLDALVEKAAKGESGAWTSLVERLTPWALREARRRLPAHVRPEDALQESLLVAFGHIGQLRDRSAFFGWFKAILRSQCFRMAASRVSESSLDQLDAYGLAPAAACRSAEDALFAAQFQSAFEEALDALPGHLREVSRLHYLGELPIPEIARLNLLPQGTIKKRLFTARRLLMDRLAAFRAENALRVGYMPISDHLLPMCADRMNQGGDLRLASRRYLSWAALAADLKRGKLDAAFIMAPLALTLLKGGTKLIYVMDGHHDGSALAISKLAKRERRLGLPAEHSTHRVLLARLMREKPELFDLPTLVVNPSSVISSMRQNKIGGFFCAEPWSAKCVSQGLAEAVLRSRDIEPGHICCILAVRREYAVRNDQAAADYVRALRRARDRICKDPSFGARVQASYANIDADVALQVLERGSISFNDLRPDQGRMEAFAKLAQDAGVLTSPCSLAGFAQPDFFGPSF